jgi:GNAT superfamily N-acetyltransferase
MSTSVPRASGSGASRLRRKARRARAAARYEGLKGLLAKGLGHVIYRRVVLVGRRLDMTLPEARSDLELSHRMLTGDDVDSYVAFRPEADAATILRRMASGSLIFGVWHEGRIVASTWLDCGSAHLDPIGVRLRLDPLDSYGRDSFTAPELRGQNVGTVCMVGALRALRDAGYECSFGFILPENRKAFGPPAKAGHDTLGSIGWIGLGPARLYFVAFTGGSLKLHPRLKRPRRPVDVDLGRPCHRTSEHAQAAGTDVDAEPPAV